MNPELFRFSPHIQIQPNSALLYLDSTQDIQDSAGSMPVYARRTAEASKSSCFAYRRMQRLTMNSPKSFGMENVPNES